MVFTPNAKEASMMLGEVYPFCRHNVYMTMLDEEWEVDRQFGGMSRFAAFKVWPPPLTPQVRGGGSTELRCVLCFMFSVLFHKSRRSSLPPSPGSTHE